jgi:hypothetical protein
MNSTNIWDNIRPNSTAFDSFSFDLSQDEEAPWTYTFCVVDITIYPTNLPYYRDV